MRPGRASSAIGHDLRTSSAIRREASRGNVLIMELSPGLARFTEIVGRDDFQLDQAALLIGAWEYPERDLDDYRELLDEIAEQTLPDVKAAPDGTARAHAISDHLFDRLGYTANSDD